MKHKKGFLNTEISYHQEQIKLISTTVLQCVSKIRHMPRRGNETIQTGSIYGPFLGSGVSRFSINSEISGDNDYLLNNGEIPKFWKSESIQNIPVPLEMNFITKPLVEGMNYTPFDLIMPFVFWDAEYEKSGKVAGRPAHIFSFSIPPHGLLRKSLIGKNLLLL